jgi:hypothetical protein
MEEQKNGRTVSFGCLCSEVTIWKIYWTAVHFSSVGEETGFLNGAERFSLGDSSLESSRSN